MKFILGALGVIFLIILVVVMVTRPSGNKPGTTEKLVVSEQAREGVSAVYTEQGKLVGQNERRAIRVVISQDQRRFEVLSGYEEAVESAQTFPNTNLAFQNFLAALQQAGFDNKKDSAVTDERGACPLGRRFVFQLNDYSQPQIDLWSTSCSKAMGTFNGNVNTTRQLFQNQIPGYSKLASKVNLNGQIAASN